mmetsp:Transcript_11945/g.28714  ORF Transcript_11945/g.28714 Transcript_11945/m.28714 type:complete len:290 (+) Transcript_11945:72-941(+)
MGRVARYKKVKSCDPYSKRNGGNVDLSTVGIWGMGDNGRRVKKKSMTVQRLKKAKELKRQNKLAKSSNIGGKKKNKRSALDVMNNEKGSGFDLPPDDIQDEFDLNDLVGSVKKQKVDFQVTVNNDNDHTINTPTTTSKASAKTSFDPSYIKTTTESGLVASIPKTDEDEMKVTKILKLDQQIQSKLDEKKQESYQRMDGESKRAFNKRTKVETRQIIHHSTVKKNLEKLQKKKEFLNNKKKNKKRKKLAAASYQNNGGGSDDDDDDDYEANDDDDDDSVEVSDVEDDSD